MLWCVALAGARSTDPDHKRAADVLQETGGGSSSISSHVRQLRMLLAKKNIVEYESRQATAKEASEAVQRAELFVSWANQIVGAAQL